MMTREELLSSKGYWLSTIQLDLYAQLEQYMKENNLNRTQLAEKLGVTKGYVSQVLNGDFDHKISKLVDLSLLMGKAPQLDYIDLAKHIEQDKFRSSKQLYSTTIDRKVTTRFEVMRGEKTADGKAFSFERKLVEEKLA